MSSETTDRVKAYGAAMYPGGVRPGTERAAQANIYAVMALADAERVEAWDDGHDAGHMDARAVQASYPDPTPNPYRQ